MSVKTKGQLINGAFSQLRVNGLTVNPSADDVSLAIDRLESMASEFEGRNICVDYSFEENPDPSTSSRISPKFNHAFETNLAIRLMPDFGKDGVKNQTLIRQASQSLSNMSALTAQVNLSRYPDRMTVGSGNTFRWNRWLRFYREEKNPVISCETEKIQLNSFGGFVASWEEFLSDGETITSFEIINTNGLEITNSQIQNNSTEIFYNAKGVKCGAQTVTVSIVTNLSTPNNADTKTVNFNVIYNASTS